MPEVPEGYKVVPEEDRIKAKVFFDRGRTVAGTGNFDYAIEMYLQGFALDPDAVEIHQELRDISLKRKASGGKAIGMWDAIKLKKSTKDDKTDMLNAEKLLASDPGNTDHMQSLLQSALRAGYWDTVLWMGAIFQKANADDKKPSFDKFIVLRDVYKGLKKWKLASDACQYALQLRPNDMELATELKNLGAMETMEKGYSKASSFRSMIRDMDKQQLLLTGDKDYADADALAPIIAAAEAEFLANQNDPSKASKYIDALLKTEQPEQEARAVEVLQMLYDTTRQFRYRQRIGTINMRQMNRIERTKRDARDKDPKNAELQKDYFNFKREQLEFELKEYQLATEAYPTDNGLKFEVGKRLFGLGRFNDAIPVFQQARNDPKYRIDAGMRLGLAFYQANFIDEADETLAGLIKDYSTQGDERSKELYYWRARCLEAKKQFPEAISHYSKVAQWDFNYRDVQVRMRKLRAAAEKPIG